MKKIESTEEINEMMMGYLSSAALNLALEKGLFWELLDQKKPDNEIADLYSIPPGRCIAWLHILLKMGLIKKTNNLYTLSPISKITIIEKYSRETWVLLAQEARERYSAIVGIENHITHPTSIWVSQGIENPNYISQMKDSVDRAERFTRMLYEIHQPLAGQISNKLDLTRVSKLLDIGGGSGIISFSLVSKYPHLIATVFDIENVCLTGRKIAKELDLDHRVEYVSGDFMQDKLPTGFDVIMECDVGIYSLELFTKVMGSLNPDGRFVIISNTNEQGARLKETDRQPSLTTLMYSFLSSLGTNEIKDNNSENLRAMLQDAGFQKIHVEHLDSGVIITEARKPLV